ncbi:hypothetical protein D6D01_04549 [Aureobasidium pullulans]|uniref:F-box domain-containing protein n=1 Tax=Aureobasidium pullulans TaxID=5580 RepID=A0A4S9LAA9_AURPU|nr:hypothetical protein D6D01_04549 [Aureobasidium pullulans]
MDTLPPEIKAMVCSFLTPYQLGPVRLVSKAFYQAAALHYKIPRIFLFNHPNSLKELDNITSHPVYRDDVTTIIIDPTSMPKMKDQHDCVRNIPADWCVPRWEDFAPPPQKRFYGVDGVLQLFYAAFGATYMYGKAWDDAKVSESKVERFWQTHNYVQSYQESTNVSAVICSKLQLAFNCCPKLRNIVLTSLHGPKSAGSKKKDSIFKYVFLGTGPQPPPRLHLDDILPIAHAGSWPVETLTIYNIVLRNRTRQTLPPLAGLSHLRIMNHIDRFHIELFDIMNAAPNLKTLWVRTDSWEDDILVWDEILRNIHLAHLEELFFGFVYFDTDDLVGFLLRHASSLRSLAMRRVFISRGWSGLLRILKHQLPNLNKVSLNLLTGMQGNDLAWYNNSFMNDAESFLLRGGLLPIEQFIPESDENDYHRRDRAARIQMNTRPGL